MKSNVQIVLMGHQCLLIQWAKAEDDDVLKTLHFLEKEYAQEILEMVPTFREIALFLHQKADKKKLLEKLKKQLPIEEENDSLRKLPTYCLPVCYEEEKGLDLSRIAEEKKISIQELIRLHTEPTYSIHFLGFLPGFPYLSGLDKQLHHPRLREPRNRIPAGSVGIANDQTGVYPHASPGGWNIIGRTPLSLFNINHTPPALLQAGSKLQFFSIDHKEYEEIQEAVQQQDYQIQKVYD